MWVPTWQGAYDSFEWLEGDDLFLASLDDSHGWLHLEHLFDLGLDLHAQHRTLK